MLTIPLAVINASSLVSMEDALAAIASVQVQVHRDFAPDWNVDVDMALVDIGEPPPSDAWWLVLLDNSDLGSALGYHDLTPQGLPIGKLFIETSLLAGQDWTVIMSHEVLEMLGDPYVCLTAAAATPTGLYLYAYENCDACQPNRFAYQIGGRLVSNFCFRAWFDASKANTAGPFDFLRLMKQPFDLLPGGYATVLGLNPYTGWQQILAPGSPQSDNMRPRVGSRRERRRTNVFSWLKSTVQMGRDFRLTTLTRPSLAAIG